MYGIVFILLGNLSGNAIALGKYTLLAAGYTDAEVTAHHGTVIGIATAALTAVIFFHMCTRRGGIFLNNGFAIFKLLIFVVIIVVGFAVRGGVNFSKAHPAPHKLGNANFVPKAAFSNLPKTVSNYTLTFLNVLYTFSGYEQPFYVCSPFKLKCPTLTL